VETTGREALVERAVALATEAFEGGDARRALELAAFATRVSNHDPHLRRLADTYGRAARAQSSAQGPSSAH
jgi:hypothetical protein